MATNDVLLVHGLQLLFADHGTDFGAAPTTAGNSLIIGVPTDVQIDLTSLGTSGGARHSAQADLTTPWGTEWAFMACIEHASGVPADGEIVDFYWAPSTSATAATGNTGATTGSDAAITDTAGGLGQIQFIGSLTLQATLVNIGFVGVIRPYTQYGSLLVVNQSTTALHTAMDETHIVANEIIDQIQAAV